MGNLEIKENNLLNCDKNELLSFYAEHQFSTDTVQRFLDEDFSSDSLFVKNICAYDSNHIVGSLFIVGRLDNNLTFVCITCILVDNHYRNRGIANSLIGFTAKKYDVLYLITPVNQIIRIAKKENFNDMSEYQMWVNASKIKAKNSSTKMDIIKLDTDAALFATKSEIIAKNAEKGMKIVRLICEENPDKTLIIGYYTFNRKHLRFLEIAYCSSIKEFSNCYYSAFKKIATIEKIKYIICDGCFVDNVQKPTSVITNNKKTSSYGKIMFGLITKTITFVSNRRLLLCNKTGLTKEIVYNFLSGEHMFLYNDIRNDK